MSRNVIRWRRISRIRWPRHN